MRILWVSNYTTNSGYAIQARLIVPRLIAAGHDVTVFNLTSAVDVEQTAGGVRLLPVGADPLGNDLLAAYASETKADVVITLVDVWAYPPEVLDRVKAYPWTPVDHYPPPPRVLHSLRGAKRPISMSRFGYDQLAAAGFDPLYAPLAYDPAVYRPLDKQRARAALGMQTDAFIVLFVGVNDSNPSRKGIGELLTAWKLFSDRHPDAVLYMHTTAQGHTSQSPFSGVNIPLLVKTLDISPDKVKLTPETLYRRGLPPETMALLYNAVDVLVLPSRGEGFGVPLIEAQACGIPVITTNFAAQEELCASGWFVEGFHAWSPFDAFNLQPDPASVEDALHTAYAARRDPRQSRLALELAQMYNIENVFHRHWKPVLEDIAHG